jgi:hypothetical protein
MKIYKKSFYISVISVFFIISIIFTGCSKNNTIKNEEFTIKDIAYDNYISSKNKISEKDYTIYIKENDVFVPYLVITSDYNGNTLLLRKYVLEKKYSFDIESLEVYYENSSLDKFLNEEYIKTLDTYIQNNVIETSILVTKGGANQKGEFTVYTYQIDRKVFCKTSILC